MGLPSLPGEELLKKILPTTLYGRALLIVVLPVIILQVVVTVVFYNRHWDTVTRRLSLSVAGDLLAIADLYTAAKSEDDKVFVLNTASYTMAISAKFLPKAELPTVIGFDNPFSVVDRRIAEALTEVMPYEFRVEELDDEAVEIQIAIPGGVLKTEVPTKRLTSSTSYIFILWMVGTSLVLVGIALLFLRNQVRPIHKLADAAEAFGKGQSVDKFRPTGAREVRKAAAAFLDMRDRITSYIRQRTEMLAGVSHDLRTPLTRMKLQLAMFPPHAGVENLQEDIQEMERMVEGYLSFARGQGDEKTQTLDVAELLQQVLSDALRKNLPVSLVVNGDLTATVQKDAVRRCIMNLVENAGKYAKSRVDIVANQMGEAIEITIEDDGPGIPEEMFEDVFRPFRRLDESRNLDKGGTGLGLTIARDIARRHGGDILLFVSKFGGLKALIRLPV